MLSLVLIPLATIIFLRINKQNQFVVFSLAALYPFTLGNFGPILSLAVVEWLTIVTFASLLNQLVKVNALEKGLSRLRYKGIHIFIFALGILVIWVIVSLVNNQIIAQKIVTGAEAGTRRTYFDIFDYVLLFFTTIIFFSTQYENISVEKFLKTILYVSIIIGFVRIYTYYYDLNTPFLAGSFIYNTKEQTNAGGIAIRFSGLDYVTIMGIPTLFALYVYKNKLNFIILIFLLIFLFLSAGRTTMIGVFFAIVIFSILFLPKNLVYLILAGGIFVLIAVIFLPEKFLGGNLTRLTTLHEKGFMGQDIWRGTTWLMFLKNFVAHPIFGKGIGDYSGFIYSPVPFTEQFVKQQLLSGGHGAYFSVLGILGLGGIVYFIIMVFGGIILSFRKIKEYVNIDIDKTAIAIFCFMQLLIFSVVFITGFNGTSNVPFLFYTVGLICSIRVMENSFINTEKAEEKNYSEIAESGLS